MILFINACVRENSRTERLARHLLGKFNEPVTELNICGLRYPEVDENFLKRRDTLIQENKPDDPMFDLARGFAAADRIVIAAPFWDLSFPAALKQYIEQITVAGITFRYKHGIPEGLCKANELWYITTSGGNYLPEDFGFGYIKALAQGFFGIKNVGLIKAQGLDINGADTERILRECEDSIDRKF